MVKVKGANTKVHAAPVVVPPSANKGKREAKNVPQKQAAAKKQKKNNGIAQAIQKEKVEAKTQKKIEEGSSGSEDSSESEYEEVLPAATKNGSLGALAKKVQQPSSSGSGDDDSDAEDEELNSDEGSSELDEDSKIEANAVKASVKSVEDDSTSEGEESEDEEIEGEEESDEEDSDDEPKEKATHVEMVDDATPKSSKKHLKPQTPVTPQAQSRGTKTLFVGNLKFDVEEDDVREFFKGAGEIVDIRLKTDENGKPKGFAHVEFATEEAAKKAFNEKTGESLMGRQLRIDFAHEKGASIPLSGKETSSKGGRGESQTVFVKGFDTSLGEDETRSALQDFFGSCGEITRVSIPVDRESDTIKGIAYLDFKDGDGFKKALKLNGEELNDNCLTVEEAKPKGGFCDSSGGGRGGGRSGGRGGGRSSGGRFSGGGGRSSGGRYSGGGRSSGGRYSGGGGGRSGRGGSGRGGGRRGGGRGRF